MSRKRPRKLTPEPAEEAAFFSAQETSYYPTSRLFAQPTRLDKSCSVLVRGTSARKDIEPGCTIAAIDYRDSRQRRNVKGYAPRLRETNSGSRGLGVT